MEAILLLLEIIFIVLVMRDTCRIESPKASQLSSFFKFK
jgi:hypothetical protein